MFALENVAKFLHDHEDTIPLAQRTKVLDECKKWTRDGVMTGGVPERVMPPYMSKQFLAEFEASLEHLEIAYKAVSRDASNLEI